MAGTSISTSPLPYSAMASQCEALGTGTRQRLSSWLTHENHYSKTSEKLFPAISTDGHSEIKMVSLIGIFLYIRVSRNKFPFSREEHIGCV